MCTILIADSCNETRDQIQRTLSAWPTYCAATAEETITLALQHRPTVIIVDTDLSQGGGCRTIKELHQRKLLEEPCRLIVLSDHDEESWVRQAYDLGANAYLIKPVKLYLLENHVRRTIQWIETWEGKQAAENQCSIVFDLLPDPAMLVDADTGNILYVNQAMLQRANLSRETMIGTSPRGLNIITEIEQARFMKEISATAGKIADFPMTYLFGDKAWNSLCSATLLEVENKSCIIAIFKDVTHVRNAVIANCEQSYALAKIEDSIAAMQRLALRSPIARTPNWIRDQGVGAVGATSRSCT